MRVNRWVWLETVMPPVLERNMLLHAFDNGRSILVACFSLSEGKEDRFA